MSSAVLAGVAPGMTAALLAGSAAATLDAQLRYGVSSVLAEGQLRHDGQAGSSTAIILRGLIRVRLATGARGAIIAHGISTPAVKSRRSDRVRVPPTTVGQPLGVAISLLGRLRLKYRIGSGEPSEDIPAGDVILTMPPAGASVDRGATVLLSFAVALPPGVVTPTSVTTIRSHSPVTIPPRRAIVGQSFAIVSSILTMAGLEASEGPAQPDTNINIGCVASISPPPGRKVFPGTTVTLSLATSPLAIPLLDLSPPVIPKTIVGKPLETAAAILAGLGLKDRVGRACRLRA